MGNRWVPACIRQVAILSGVYFCIGYRLGLLHLCCNSYREVAALLRWLLTQVHYLTNPVLACKYYCMLNVMACHCICILCYMFLFSPLLLAGSRRRLVVQATPTQQPSAHTSQQPQHVASVCTSSAMAVRQMWSLPPVSCCFFLMW